MNTFKKIISWFTMIALLVAAGYGFYFLTVRGIGMWLVILIAVYSLNGLFALAIFSQRRHASAKLSWIIVIVTLPFFGHVIFALFGRRFKNRISRKEYISANTFKYEDLSVNKKIDPSILDIFQKQSIISNRGMYNCDLKFYSNGNDAFSSMFKDMRAAKNFIHIHFYIIHPGEIYEEFKSILLQKVKEGVKIRFIVDDFGRWAMPWYQINELKKQGVEIEIFGKVTFPFIGSQNGYRTHRKMVIVDGNVVHTGGMNIGDEYANLDKKYGNWLDLHIKVTGTAVRSFSLLFIEDWKLLTHKQLEVKKHLKETKTGKSQMVLVEDGPYIKEAIIEASIVNWIHQAKKTIKLATPYFIPTDNVFNAIKTAAISGVDVTIFLPGKADKNYVLLASRHWAKELIQYGVKFRKVNGMMIHSKLGMFDREYAYAGTANIDMRSIYSQFEMVSLLSGPSIKGVQDLFKDYKKMSKLLGEKDLSIRKIWNRLLRIIFSVFAPVM